MVTTDYLDGKLGNMLSVRNRSRFLTVLALALVWTTVAPAAGTAEPPAPADPTSRVERIDSTEEPVELLSPDEVEQLEARDEEPGAEIVGGALSNQELTYIVIALAAAVLVLVLK